MLEAVSLSCNKVKYGDSYGNKRKKKKKMDVTKRCIISIYKEITNKWRDLTVQRERSSQSKEGEI